MTVRRADHAIHATTCSTSGSRAVLPGRRRSDSAHVADVAGESPIRALIALSWSWIRSGGETGPQASGADSPHGLLGAGRDPLGEWSREGSVHGRGAQCAEQATPNWTMISRAVMAQRSGSRLTACVRAARLRR